MFLSSTVFTQYNSMSEWGVGREMMIIMIEIFPCSTWKYLQNNLCLGTIWFIACS